MTVEGASIMVHSDVDGIFAINGELIDDSNVPLAKPTINLATAIAIVLAESHVPSKFYDQCNAPSLMIVHGIEDGEAHMVWACIVCYDVTGKDGHIMP